MGGDDLCRECLICNGPCLEHGEQVFNQYDTAINVDDLPDDDLRWVIFKVLRHVDVTNEVLVAIRNNRNAALTYLGGVRKVVNGFGDEAWIVPADAEGMGRWWDDMTSSGGKP